MAETTTPPVETVADDDLCPICHLLLYAPVRTQCSHLLCLSCMAQWADASTSSTTNIIHSSTDTALRHFDASYDAAYDLSASCPMCRTQTTATPDAILAHDLEQKYPTTYASRRHDEEIDSGLRAAANGAEGIMILIGNRHRRERTASESMNQHDWTFFTRFSRTDIIKEVRVNLHPTFRPPRVTLRAPPFEVRRLGWGTFVISATVVLKRPYVWVMNEDDEVTAGLRKDELELEWMLDFEGRGRQGRVRAKVRRDEEAGEEVEGMARRTRSAVRGRAGDLNAGLEGEGEDGA